jgi:transposase
MMSKIDGRSLDHRLSEHLRIMAVRRVVEGGERPSDVMSSMGLHRTSIYPWLKTYDEGGFEGLKGTKAVGPTPKLSEKQCQKVRTWIIGKDPRQYGFDFGLWTRNIIRELIKERFDVEVSLATVGGLLARLGITPQRPLRRAYERDPAAIDHWVQTEYPALRRRAQRNGAAIFFLDEAGFSSEPNLGRTYGQKGETPVVQTTGQRQKVSAISAVNAKGAFWCSVYTGMLNAERFVEFLQAFLKTRRGKVYLVVDGHPSHRAKKVQAFVQATRGRLELHFLPPYAPDLNPDEFVWQYAKTNGLAKKPLKKGESLRERVEVDLGLIAKDKPLIRSFFRAKSVVYAADL